MPDSQRLAQYIEQAWRGSPIWLCTFKHWQLQWLVNNEKCVYHFVLYTHKNQIYTCKGVYFTLGINTRTRMNLNQKLYRGFVALIAPRGKPSFRPLYRLFQAAAAALILVFVVNLFSIGKSTFGEWGDFFGGVLNPLLTFLMFMGLLITIVIQQTELRESRVELKRSADALRDQNENLRKQNFENTFFQMLEIHNQIVNAIDLVSEQGKVTKGRDCFSVFYTRFNKIYRENKGKANDRHTEESVVKLAYQLFWKEHQTELGHYFRYLYNMVRFVKESQQVDGPYLRLIRAQLSDQELLLLFYNCVSNNGGNFTSLVEEFALLNNIPEIRLLHTKHKAMLQPSAFGAKKNAQLDVAADAR